MNPLIGSLDISCGDWRWNEKKLHADPSVPIWAAIVEVMVVVILAPMIAALSFVGLSTMKWWVLGTSSSWVLASKYALVIVMFCMALFGGRWWLRRKFAKCIADTDVCLTFDTERDRRIVYWQKFSILVICGMIIPWLGLAVMYLVE